MRRRNCQNVLWSPESRWKIYLLHKFVCLQGSKKIAFVVCVDLANTVVVVVVKN
jgi:hypothetical protein